MSIKCLIANMKHLSAYTLSDDVIKEMTMKYIYHVCIEEDIGIKNISEIKALLHFANTNEKDIKGREMIGIANGLNMLKKLCAKEESKNIGLLAITWLKDLHMALMTSLLDETKVGCVSTNIRTCTYKGEEYVYPIYHSEFESEYKLQQIIDNMNAPIFKIKAMLTKSDLLEKGVNLLLELLVWFIHMFLDMHPFADGNGRLCRVIVSYYLNLLFPFPITIHNVHNPKSKSTFIDLLVKIRKDATNKMHTKHLQTLLIDSCNAFCQSALNFQI